MAKLIFLVLSFLAAQVCLSKNQVEAQPVKEQLEYLPVQARRANDVVTKTVDQINREIQNHKGEIDGAVKEAGNAIGGVIDSVQSFFGRAATGNGRELKSNEKEILKKISEELGNRLQRTIKLPHKGFYDDFLASVEYYNRVATERSQEAGVVQ